MAESERGKLGTGHDPVNGPAQLSARGVIDPKALNDDGELEPCTVQVESTVLRGAGKPQGIPAYPTPARPRDELASHAPPTTPLLTIKTANHRLTVSGQCFAVRTLMPLAPSSDSGRGPHCSSALCCGSSGRESRCSNTPGTNRDSRRRSRSTRHYRCTRSGTHSNSGSYGLESHSRDHTTGLRNCRSDRIRSN
jgi:hypothetical protein